MCSCFTLNEDVCKTAEAQSDQQSTLINLSDSRVNLKVQGSRSLYCPRGANGSAASTNKNSQQQSQSSSNIERTNRLCLSVCLSESYISAAWRERHNLTNQEVSLLSEQVSLGVVTLLTSGRSPAFTSAVVLHTLALRSRLVFEGKYQQIKEKARTDSVKENKTFS